MREKGEIDKHKYRPFFCFDRGNRILYSTYNDEHYKDGFSLFCYGKLKKPHIFTKNKAEHINDVCHCYYTPLKGAIRFFINKGDIWGEIYAHCAVFNKLQKNKCPRCGSKTYLHPEHQCFNLTCLRAVKKGEK